MTSLQLLTTAEVASLLRVSADTVRRMADSGKLSPYRLGGGGRSGRALLRFAALEVERFLAEAKGEAIPSQGEGATEEARNEGQESPKPARKRGARKLLASAGLARRSTPKA